MYIESSAFDFRKYKTYEQMECFCDDAASLSSLLSLLLHCMPFFAAEP
jgi:hypothetical protein